MTTATAAQLGTEGIQSIFDMVASYGLSVTLPEADTVSSISVDGRDVTITHDGGVLEVALNKDMELDLIHLRLNTLSIVHFDDAIPADAGDVLIHDGTGFAPVPQSDLATDGEGGYEFSGAFVDRGSDVQYTTTMAANNTWYRFGFSQAAQTANDVAYFPTGDLDPFDQTKGMFGGAHMPIGVTNLFDFSTTEYQSASTATYASGVSNTLSFTDADGSYDLSECRVGDLIKIRFSFNATPQVANTTLEVGLIFATRNTDDEITFEFPLTTQPIYYGTGTQGVEYLNRVEMSAYIASEEDLNALLLPAIRSNNEILIEPLTTLISVVR